MFLNNPVAMVRLVVLSSSVAQCLTGLCACGACALPCRQAAAAAASMSSAMLPHQGMLAMNAPQGLAGVFGAQGLQVLLAQQLQQVSLTHAHTRAHTRTHAHSLSLTRFARACV